MNTSQKKKAVVGSIAGLVLVGGTALGGIAVANANTTGTDSMGTSDVAQDERGESNEAKVKGSISVPESATEVSDAEESAQLAKLATIDTSAAEKAAAASVPGSTVVSSELGDEDGFVVYEVDVKDDAGTVTEVTVDAGDASILASETGDDDDDQEDGNEAKVKGSISVPESATEVSDAEESAQLAKLATIDASAAEKAATASVPGSTVVSSELDEEDGFVVYEVDVKDGAGTVTEVTVDAGDAGILASETGDDD
ncbi:hypothetical protein E8P82_11435 [Arthrobacter echini]|uniref:Uncharacterized protein n=2 Tax=Arthrobacter echini TaxID=1529066 RepID=A0A5D0XIL2_9MICC|nr:PepSY domain-containing protein [Arthrobacter echini]THJ65591.1 hypothetical protein E8P82_11435 [Arthrobacter echini]TYC96452.1 hypothetical protein FQ377_13925 [Arthrobacter echini]